MKPAILLLTLVFFWITAAVADDEDGYNEYTIRPSDIPTDAPKFEQFPSKPWSGQNAEPKLHGDTLSRMYSTRLKAWAREKPNFAGHYILATWGCGTECNQIAIIDAKTGRIFHPPGATTNVAANVHRDFLDGDDLWHAAGAIRFRPDSRLLILIGMPEERVENRGISYYVWEDDRLKRIRFIHKAWYPEPLR